MILLLLVVSSFMVVRAEETSTVLKATITAVPNAFYGTWRVVSNLVDTDSPMTFKKQGLDIWNLSRLQNVITLNNPFNGANAEISITKVDSNSIVFSKTGKYGYKVLTDTVELKLKGGTFSGVDTLQLNTYSDVDGKIIKTENAKYSITGEKIAGQSITGD